MKEVYGNLWELPGDIRCITTNGFVKADGSAVMGRGCAKEAAQRFPKLPAELGERLRREGNTLHYFGQYNVLTFPVKHNWWEEADPALIRRMAAGLKHFAESMPHATILLPRPGCGNGKLKWEDVRSLLLAAELPDNVHIVTWDGGRHG